LSGVAETVRLLADAGAAGCSIEDYDPAAGRLDAVEVAAERAAVAAGAKGDVTLTARCESHLYGGTDLDDTIVRLVAYRDAGADVVYAPGLTDFALMEFGAFLRYKGAELAADSSSGDKAGAIILEGPHQFDGGKCVPYRAVPCTHVTSPRPGTVVLTFPEDEPRGGGAMSLRPAEPALAYEPVVIPAMMPWLTVSVMPHQPMVRTPKKASNGGSFTALPNMRK
jgi:hypothetical protein